MLKLTLRATASAFALWTAVALQFEHIFAGERMRRGEQDRDALVDDAAVRRPQRRLRL